MSTKELFARGGVPRVVVVTRPTEYEALLVRHGTVEQARFFLKTHGQDMGVVEDRHRRFEATLAALSTAIPRRWRRSDIARVDLDRFVFEKEDIVVCVGQDGLVANVGKYLDGQLVVGINPDPARFDGVLARHRIAAAADLFDAIANDRARVDERTMVEARTDDGQRLLAVNEIFVGHETHQSARYRIAFGGREEAQSSSGVVVASGTGATGWMRSILLGRGIDPFADLPAKKAAGLAKAMATARLVPRPDEARLTFCVREAFPSLATRTTLLTGEVTTERHLSIVSEMNEGGTLFGDGIEEDAVELRYGLRVDVGVARERLCLVQ